MPLCAVACEKVPLLAPTGSTITLTASSNALSINATADIIAQVLENAGTPPHSGTVITFTTTLGSIEPSEARTDTSGRVVVKFRAGTGNGTATISATSGGATTGTNGAIKIAIGTAAVARVALTANPNPVSANGGVTTITANVIDINGNPLVSAPVNFATSAGVLASTFANTDGNGIALTTLTTSAQATVTATVGVPGTTTTPPPTGGTPATGSTSGQASATVQVNVNPLPIVSIAAPSGNLIANSPITFTLTAQPGKDSTATIRSVTVNFGDGDVAELGAVSGTGITVQHKYDTDRTYTVRVTAVDSLGTTASAATVVVVQPEPPLSVSVSATSTLSGTDKIYTFTATVSPATATVASYLWNFGDNSSQSTSNNTVVHTYAVGAAAKTVTVLVTTTTGRQQTGTYVVTGVAPVP